MSTWKKRDWLVLGVIGVVLSALLVTGIQRTREEYRRAQCNGNLHRIGTAVHAYHDAHGFFPDRLNMSPRAGLGAFLGTDVPTERAALFLCPSRHGVEVGMMCDFTSGDLHALTSAPWYEKHWKTFFHYYNARVARDDITNADGTESTLIWTHGGMSPKSYRAFRDHPFFFPYPYAFVRDHGDGHVAHLADATRIERRSMESLLGSPHPTGMPCLFADASVRTIAYTRNPTPADDDEPFFIAKLWYWNDGQTADPAGSVNYPGIEPLH